MPLQRIRRAREYAAQALNCEFPFTRNEWFVQGQELMFHLREIDKDASFDRLVTASKDGQLAWKRVMLERFKQFEYEELLALKWFVDGKDGSVVIDPRVSFGAPAVAGIPTWVLKGRWDAGESIEEIVDDFGLEPLAVTKGLRFEGAQFAA